MLVRTDRRDTERIAAWRRALRGAALVPARGDSAPTKGAAAETGYDPQGPDPQDSVPEGPNGLDRGGPVGRGEGGARATMRAATPERDDAAGASRREPAIDAPAAMLPSAESSPVGAEPRWRIVVSWLLAVAACIAIASAFTILAKAHAGQLLLDVAWKRAQATGHAPAPWPWADTRPVAKLYAPRQQVERLMLAGATGRTLAWGPGIADGTARPGERGNAVVTAHRDTHFRFLADVAIGDALVVERADGVRVDYRIVATRIADAESLAIPRDVDVPTLTLVTCWPFGAVAPGGSLRYVVVAEVAGALPRHADVGARRPTRQPL